MKIIELEKGEHRLGEWLGRVLRVVDHNGLEAEMAGKKKPDWVVISFSMKR